MINLTMLFLKMFLDPSILPCFLSAKIANTTYPPLEISILIRGFEHYSETKVIWIKDLAAYFDNIFKLNKRYSGHVITGVIIEA